MLTDNEITQLEQMVKAVGERILTEGASDESFYSFVGAFEKMKESILIKREEESKGKIVSINNFLENPVDWSNSQNDIDGLTIESET